MKRLLLMLVAFSVLLVGCKKEKQLPTVSFESQIGLQINEIAEFTAVRSNNDGAPVEIQLSFSGTAVLDVDYTVSTKKFILGGANEINRLIVTPINLGTKKTVIVKMIKPAGYKLGKISTATCVLSDKLGYVSFEKSNTIIGGEGSLIKVNLKEGNGQTLKASKKLRLRIDVDPKLSTAVEGENFEIENKDNLFFEQGNSEAEINIKLLKYDVNKDKLVLKINDNDLFSAGENYKIEIKFVSSLMSVINGKWVAKKMLNSKEEYANSWGFNISEMAGYPEIQEGDSLTLDFSKGKIIPAFKSELKNYFIGESDITAEGLIKIGYGLKRVDMQSFRLSNVNRNFDANSMSDEKDAVITIMLDNANPEHPVLKLFIIDFVSTSFARQLLDLEVYNLNNRKLTPKGPVASDAGTYLMVEFER